MTVNKNNSNDPKQDSVLAASSESSAWRLSPKVRIWERGLIEAGCTLQQLELLKGLYKGDGSLLFALIKATGVDPEGHALLPYALLRGAAVVVVPAITVIETGETLFLTVSQRRMGHGRLSLEFPAGMLDEAIGDPAGVAHRELEEETGLRIDAALLQPLFSKPLFSSPGLSDESIWFFGCQLHLTRAACDALHGGLTGSAYEGEHIQVELIPRAALLSRTDSLQTLLALHLFDAWKAQYPG